MKAWEIGSIVGIIVGIIYFLLTSSFLMRKFGSGLISNLIPGLGYAVVGFILGALIGWIVGKIKQRKEVEDENKK